MHGFILQPTYRVEGGRPVVRIYGRLDTGESFLVTDSRHAPRFYVRSEDADRAGALGARARPADPPRVTMAREPVHVVEVEKPTDVPPLREALAEYGIPTYEADVRFAYRYLIDLGVRGAIRIEGSSRPGRSEEGVDLVFENPTVRAGDRVPALRVLSFDIETDPQAQRLLSIALWGCGASDVLLLNPPGFECPPDAEACATEKQLLEAFVRRVRETDPDVLTGWNVVGFDLTVLARIAARHGVQLALGRGPEPLRLRPSASPRGGSEARVPGRLVLDGIELVRGAFLRFESYSLNAVAGEVLGERKTLAGPDRAEEILRRFREDRPALVEYNRADARLALQVLERLGLPELAVERSRLTGMPPDRVSASIASFDYLYLSELSRRGIVAPSVRSGTPPADVGGGHVLEPDPGLYRNVLVLDFKSLYPSVIRTFQIDPLGLVRAPSLEEDPIRAPNGAAFRRDPGILPGILDELFPRREKAKRAGNRAGDQAIKILMNSFYGVLGSSACRFASPALANAITGFGREILLWAKDRVVRSGYRVLYGDTDSLFVESREPGADGARSLGAELARRLNEDLADHVEKRWRVESRLEIEFETLYARLFLPLVRHGTGGARKRYAGLADDGGKERLVFVGLEVVRRDWTELARRVQRELYARLFSDRAVADYLKGIVEQLRAGELDQGLVYRKGLRKKLGAYVASTPPHVAAARKMSRRPGWVVEYVMTRDGPEPAEERRSPIDHEHYVQKQVRPVAEPVLALLGLEFDRVVGDDAQLELF